METRVLKSYKSFRTQFDDLIFKDKHAIFLSAREGVKPTVFYHFAEAIRMTEKELARIINLSARTIHNYKEQKKSFAPIESEHLLKLIALYNKGEAVFGHIDEFTYWLKKPFWNSDETPMDWLSTPGGVDLVMAEIDRLAHGYAV